MRLLLVLTIILAVIISFSFWTNHLLQTSADEILQSIEEIEQALGDNEWELARSRADELEKTWGEKAGWWPAVLDHQEIDNIEFSMAKTKEYIATEDASLSRGQLSELKLMISHIPEKESLKTINIF